MRRFLAFSFVLSVSLGSVWAAGPHAYVGSKACSPCHKTEKQGKQVVVWQTSQHSKAFQTLKTPESQKIAEKAGVKGPATEAAACLKCHVTGHGEAATAFKPTFAKEDGVQCEGCHGPGSDYKNLTVMKDRAKAIAAGLTDVSVKDGSAEKQCKGCHNQQSPTFKGFNFKEAWAKIAHPIPKS